MLQYQPIQNSIDIRAKIQKNAQFRHLNSLNQTSFRNIADILFEFKRYQMEAA